MPQRLANNVTKSATGGVSQARISTAATTAARKPLPQRFVEE
jgi:hypothetical protein